MALNFSSPIFLFGLLAVSIPVLIHLLTQRQQTHIKFSAVYLLTQSQKRSIKRSQPNKFLLLLLRCLAIAFLSLGLAHPLYSLGTSSSPSTAAPSANAIILDDSYSMGWKSEKNNVFKYATDTASQIISQLAEGSSTHLILTSTPNKPVKGSGDDAKVLLKKLKFAQPSFLTSDIGSSLSTAIEALESSKFKEKRLYIITDGDKNAWDDSKFSDIGDRLNSVITTVINLNLLRKGINKAAIKNLEIRQEFLTNSKFMRVKTEIVNLSEKKSIENLTVGLHVNEKTISESSVHIDVNSTGIKEFSFPQLGIEPAIGFVKLEDDALLTDNRNFFAYRPNQKISVLAVDGDPKTVATQSETFYLERALNPFYGSHSDIEPAVSTLEELPSRDLQNFSVVFLCNVRELPPSYEFELERFVNAGGSLFISLGDQVDPKFYNEKLGNLIPVVIQNINQSQNLNDEFKLSFKETNHPVLVGFEEKIIREMEAIRFNSFFKVESRVERDLNIPLRFSDGTPAVIETKFGEGKVILFVSTADRDWNDFPIQPTFLPWVQRWVKYAADGLDTFSQGNLLPGTPFFWERNQDKIFWIQSPDNKVHYFKNPEKGFSKTFRPGVYRIFSNSKPSNASQKTVVNPSNLPPGAELVGTFSVNIDSRESQSKNILENEIKSLLPSANLILIKNYNELKKSTDTAATPLTLPLLLMAAFCLCLEGLVLRRE
jgi:hypothetical protein